MYEKINHVYMHRRIPQHMLSHERNVPLLFELYHNVRDLHVLLGLILGCDFEDDILLVIGDWFLAYSLNKLAQPNTCQL